MELAHLLLHVYSCDVGNESGRYAYVCERYHAEFIVEEQRSKKCEMDVTSEYGVVEYCLYIRIRKSIFYSNDSRCESNNNAPSSSQCSLIELQMT